MGDLGRPLSTVSRRLSVSTARAGGALVAVELELVEGNAAADEPLRLLVVGAGEAQQHRARPQPLGRTEALVGVLGEARDRAADAASLIDLVAQAAARAAARLDQGRGEQRQAAGLFGDVTDQRREQPRLDPEPCPPGGSSIARRSSSRRIGPTRSWLALTRVESSACSAQRA